MTNPIPVSTMSDPDEPRTDPVADPVTIKEATRRCGWVRENTFRERFLATEEDASSMGLRYDARGRAILDPRAVEEAVRKIEAERARRPSDWRVRNLKHHAKRCPKEPALERNRRRPASDSS